MVNPITKEDYGKTSEGAAVTRYTLSNSKGVSVKILDYGGIITDIWVPDREGKVADINLGCKDIGDYQTKSRFFGALCGRVANRIAGAEFTLDGRSHKLEVNNGPNSLHGGKVGFDKKIWGAKVTGDQLVLTYVSPDGEENYPGELTTVVTYCLDDENNLKLDYASTTTKPTILNLTNHSYFNLGGHDCGHLRDHVVTMVADSYLPLDEHSIPIGEVRNVEGSAYDLRSPTKLGDRLGMVPGGKGFDNNFCLDNKGVMKHCTRMEHPPSGRCMDVSTTEPGMQFYTSFYLQPTLGKDGANYGQFGAFCLEAQHYPDSIHRPDFPSTVLRPGETYSQTTVYTFGVC